jgi:hypothetical protein
MVIHACCLEIKFQGIEASGIVLRENCRVINPAPTLELLWVNLFRRTSCWQRFQMTDSFFDDSCRKITNLDKKVI